MNEPRTPQDPRPVGNLVRTLMPGHAAEVELARRELTDLIYTITTHTREVAQLRSQVTNDVLSSELIILDGSGQAIREFRVPYGSLAIANHSGADITVHAGAPMGLTPPGAGRGVHRVPAGVQRVINIAHHVVTLFGAAGAAVSLEVFTKSQPPSSGDMTALTATGGANLTSVAGAVVGTALLPANPARRGVIVFNDSTATLYLGYTTPALISTSVYTVQIAAGGYWEAPLPVSTGPISGLWSAAAGNARITELS